MFGSCLWNIHCELFEQRPKSLSLLGCWGKTLCKADMDWVWKDEPSSKGQDEYSRQRQHNQWTRGRDGPGMTKNLRRHSLEGRVGRRSHVPLYVDPEVERWVPWSSENNYYEDWVRMGGARFQGAFYGMLRTLDFHLQLVRAHQTFLNQGNVIIASLKAVEHRFQGRRLWRNRVLPHASDWDVCEERVLPHASDW